MTAEWPPPGWHPAPAPLRVGDAERDGAVRQLGEHHAAGRLDLVEFEQRVGAAFAAKTTADLHALFWDLPPALTPQPLPRGRARSSTRQRRRRVAVGLAGLALAVGGFVSTGLGLTAWDPASDGSAEVLPEATPSVGPPVPAAPPVGAYDQRESGQDR